MPHRERLLELALKGLEAERAKIDEEMSQLRSQLHRDLGPNYFDRINAEQVKRKLLKRLESLGLKVILEARPQEG